MKDPLLPRAAIAHLVPASPSDRQAPPGRCATTVASRPHLIPSQALSHDLTLGRRPPLVKSVAALPSALHRRSSGRPSQYLLPSRACFSLSSHLSSSPLGLAASRPSRSPGCPTAYNAAVPPPTAIQSLYAIAINTYPPILAVPSRPGPVIAANCQPVVPIIADLPAIVVVARLLTS
ncbi:hypothetical protein NL676_000415 [Syzygium grande]|nr:hypothetical protein NL676_000415 [Syzygium grande]